VKDAKTKQARKIADLEQQAYLAGERERAAAYRLALAALFGRNTGPSSIAALEEVTKELAIASERGGTSR
jgi:hypothetical protein